MKKGNIDVEIRGKKSTSTVGLKKSWPILTSKLNYKKWVKTPRIYSVCV